MRRLLFAALLAALFATPAMAQNDFPLLEISMGYGNLSLFSGHHSGFVSQQDINLTKWYGIDNYIGYFNLGSNTAVFSNVFGGRVIARSPKGYAAYGVAGLGFSNFSQSSLSLGNMASTRIGGGIDVPFNQAMKLRVDVTRISFHTGNGGAGGPTWTSGTSVSGGLLLVLQ